MKLPDKPKLRPVEVIPAEHEGERIMLVHDPSGLAAGTIAMSGPGLFLLSLMDGRHTRDEIRDAFAEQFGQPVPVDQFNDMIGRLDGARFLDSPTFTAWFDARVAEYRAAPARVTDKAESYGIDGEGPAETIARMLAGCSTGAVQPPASRLAGLIAPHLDYTRGAPCYADIYGLLATCPPPGRFVILGTNHFGRSTSVVATRKDFQTPLGLTRTDRAFLEALNTRLGADLCDNEYDHAREHSVELQLLILQHLFGAEAFEIVPVLCHDPCGPNGTAPYDGRGVDLRDFARHLGELIRSDPVPTVVIAGADLSHVGRRFGDDLDLDEPFLSRVSRQDRQALEAVSANQPDVFVRSIAAHENSTRICSAGCIYALLTALPGVEGQMLRYHQASSPENETCVTCAAVAFWEVPETKPARAG